MMILKIQRIFTMLQLSKNLKMKIYFEFIIIIIIIIIIRNTIFLLLLLLLYNK